MGCPDASTLRRLLDGHLSVVEEPQIIAHVDACESCQRVLAEIEDPSQLDRWRALQPELPETLSSPSSQRVGGSDTVGVPRRDEYADRNRLFGLLAWRLNFIDREQLVDALGAWDREPSKTVGQFLHDRGVLRAELHDLLEMLVTQHIEWHEGNPRRSLKSLKTIATWIEPRDPIGDRDVHAIYQDLGAKTTDCSEEMKNVGVDATGFRASVGGRFRRLHFHDRGGLGEIYVARDQEVCRDVALKQICAEAADDPDRRLRFLFEAQITGGLEHPGIVPVYGLGTDSQGRPFYAMRFIRGDSLKDAIATFRAEVPNLDATSYNLRLRSLLGRFLDICNTIAYAHSRGVLHRDLKPDNVMLGPYGETLIIDWGLAKRSSEASRDPSAVPEAPDGSSTVPTLSDEGIALTQAGRAMGTPAYMSPEQAAGRVEDLGPSTDIYALGAVLYAVLTGCSPVEGADVPEILDRVRRGSIELPRSHCPRVPRALAAIALKALALRPEDRYGSARTLAEDVERFLADEPVTACRDPLLTRAWRWVRKHRTLAASVAASVLIGSITLALAYAREAEYAESLTVANQLAESRLDLAMTSIEDYFTGVNEEALKGGAIPESLRARLLEKPRAFYEQLNAELASKPDPSERERYLLAQGRLLLGRILEILGRNAESLREYREAQSGFEGLVAEFPANPIYRDGLSQIRSNLGNVLQTLGQSGASSTSHRQAIAIAERLALEYPDVPTYRETLATTLSNYVQATEGGNVESLAMIRRAVDLLRQLVADDPDVPEFRDRLVASLNNLGNVQDGLGRGIEALASYRDAIGLLERLRLEFPDVPRYREDLAIGFHNLGETQDDLGRFSEALASYRNAIEHWDALTMEFPDVPGYRDGLATSHNALGGVDESFGRLEEALVSYRRAVELQNMLTSDFPDVPEYRDDLAASLSNLGIASYNAGRPTEALALFRRGTKLRDSLTIDFPDIPSYRDGLATSLINLGSLETALGLSVDSLATNRRAVALLEGLATDFPDVPGYQDGLATGLCSLSNAYDGLDLGAEASAALRRAITILESLIVDEPNRPDYRDRLGMASNNLANRLERDGNRDEAIALYTKAIRSQRSLIDEYPQIVPYRVTLFYLYGNLGDVLRAAGRIAEAVAAVRASIELHPDDPRWLYSSAAQLVHCLRLLDDSGSETDHRAVANEAVATLTRAFEAGWAEPSEMVHDPDFDPLRGRDDLRHLIARMFDRIYPVDPFSK